MGTVINGFIPYGAVCGNDAKIQTILITRITAVAVSRSAMNGRTIWSFEIGHFRMDMQMTSALTV